MNNTKPMKIVLLGDPGTGKTSLWSRLITTHFDPNYVPTNGVNFDSHSLLVGDQMVEMDLWELAGHKKWHCLADGLLRDADGILLVYDISKSATFESLPTWLRLIRQASPKTVIKLVGNKNDLVRMVLRKEAKQFATDNDLYYIETSALDYHNVPLAFESIAQEINVATHSVSAPLKAPFGHNTDEKPFQVVLIDIEQAARDKTIVCVKKPLEDPTLKFLAISYRWGEVEEQVIDTKLGYMASITSFGLNDFYKLCQDMLQETDLQAIKYVWVDAICVDQNNQARRKATIYQMSNIYHRAAYILAVPDLHLKYLTTNGIFDRENEISAYRFREFIYYLLHEKFDPLAPLTEKWFDEMGIPKAVMARKYLTRYPWKSFTTYLEVYNTQDEVCDSQDDDSPCQFFCQHNCYNTDSINCHHTPNSMLNSVQYAINECHYHSKDDNMVYKSSGCALCSLQMDICKHRTESQNKYETIPDSDQKWLACVLRELRYDKYKRLVTERSEAVAKVITFLQYLIEDWSSRVWVISEYTIAKAKQSRKLKFWFLSLRIDWKNVEKLDFFVFDFDKQEENASDRHSKVQLDFVTSRAIEIYRLFQSTLKFQLNERCFLEIMLTSKASRNEDRFYAIFPSTEYSKLLTSREVVSSWQIDNIVSVKLKLYELMTTKDKLDLLYLAAYSSCCRPACAFPAFANIDERWWNFSPVKEQDEKNCQCNFDLNNDATLRLVPPDAFLDNESRIRFHKLSLSPKMYYVIHNATGYVKEGLDAIFNNNKVLLETLEINYVGDELVIVYIPMYMRNIDCEDLYHIIEHIALFGSFKKSKWLLCQAESTLFASAVSSGNFFWKHYDNSDGDYSFDIY